MLSRMILATLLSVVLVAVTYVLYWVYKKQQFFERRNVKHTKATFLFGHAYKSLIGKRHTCDIIDESYRAFPDEDIVGHYELFNPQLIIRNPEYVESILIKDFAHFHDRLKTDGEIKCPADANLFFLSGNTWRAVRHKFSPLFTSGKLKSMYHSISDCGKALNEVLDENDGKEVEMSDIMGLFAMDVIGSSAFGIEANLLRNPNSKFREMGKKIFENSILLLMKMLIIIFLPLLAKILRLRGFFKQSCIKYFTDVVSETIHHREKEGFIRNDFVQMLLQLKQKGKIELQVHDPGDDYLIMDKSLEIFELEITEDILVGGAFSFLFAGFHATAMTLTYTLFELSQNPKATETLRAEIKDHIKGELPTYEELKNMSYVEKVLKESLRMHPTAPGLGRMCNKDYTFPNGMTMKVGETVFIPVQSLQMDPSFWPDPQTFNPDRFDPACPPKPGTYIPFGEGPRICIAMRFAMLEMKYALVILLKNYNFELSEKTKLPLTMKPRVFLATPEGGITFRVTKI